MTFTGTLEDGVIRWDGDAPPPGQPVRVTATASSSETPDGPRLAVLLEQIAALPADERLALEQWGIDNPPVPLALPHNGPALAAILERLASRPADQGFTLEQWEADRADEEPPEYR